MASDNQLRIGVDGACWRNRRGYGRYTRSLLSALARQPDGDRYVLFLDPETAGAVDLPPGVDTVVVPTRRSPATAASATGRRTVSDLWRMGRAVARQPLDLMFFPSVYTFFPILRPVAAVVTIHDTIPERHPAQVFPTRKSALFWRAKLAIALRQARMILTVSETARQAILDHFGLAPERVRAVPEAPDPIFQPRANPRDAAELLPECHLPRRARYLLYVGGLSPHKNLPLLLAAFQRLVAEPVFDGVHLLLVGDHVGDVFYSAYPDLCAAVRRDGLAGRVHFTGFVPDEVLVDLYNGAELVVLPSLEEGFGLPAFEAAACGAPVVASDVGPVSALLGTAVWTFSPHDREALAAALDALVRDPVRRQAMGTEGRRRVAALSWERTAQAVHELFHEVARA